MTPAITLLYKLREDADGHGQGDEDDEDEEEEEPASLAAFRAALQRRDACLAQFEGELQEGGLGGPVAGGLHGDAPTQGPSQLRTAARNGDLACLEEAAGGAHVSTSHGKGGTAQSYSVETGMTAGKGDNALGLPLPPLPPRRQGGEQEQQEQQQLQGGEQQQAGPGPAVWEQQEDAAAAAAQQLPRHAAAAQQHAPPTVQLDETVSERQVCLAELRALDHAQAQQREAAAAAAAAQSKEAQRLAEVRAVLHGVAW